MLVCYARELKEGFAEYAEQVVKIMVTHLKFYFHDGNNYYYYNWLLFYKLNTCMSDFCWFLSRLKINRIFVILDCN